MAQAPLTAEWFKILNRPHLKALVNGNPHILSKLQRPYLHRRLGPLKRLRSLRQHYLLVQDLLGENLCRELYRKSGMELAKFDLNDAGKYSIRLSYNERFEKEGDLTLALLDATNCQPLFSLTFSLISAGVDAEMFIGCLQGHKFENQRERIVQITRSLHGLRPKALLLFAAQTLAQIWGVNRIRAVGDTEHIYRRYGRRRNFHAQYNEFWIENQGAQAADGNFTITAFPARRNIAEISPNKRSLYRRRYAMTDEFRRQIESGIRGIPPLESVKPFDRTPEAVLKPGLGVF